MIINPRGCSSGSKSTTTKAEDIGKGKEIMTESERPNSNVAVDEELVSKLN